MKMHLFPFKGKVVGGVGAMAKEFTRLRIPVPKFEFADYTPLGVKVRSTVSIPSNALNSIDEGIGNQIYRHSAKYPNWNVGKLHSEYSVLLIDPMTTNVENEPGSPAILVQGIQTAGTGIRDGGEKLVHIVAPHQQNQEWQFKEYFKNTIWFESEHCRENWNDLDVFNRYVGGSDVHPHVP